MANQEEYMTVGQARELLKISRGLMTKWIREGRLKAEDHPFDKRIKMVRRADVEELRDKLARYPRTPKSRAA